MRRLYYVFIFVGMCFFACETMPKKLEENIEETNMEESHVEEAMVNEVEKENVVVEVKKVEQEAEDVSHENEVIAEFGEVKITKKNYNDTMSEIKVVVEELNKTTSSKNYSTWLKFLSNEYRETYSKPSVLKSTSDTLPVKGLKLNNLKDFFNYVFVPSRQNIKVDDIKFLSPVKVNVIMFTKGKELLVYNLEKINEKWLLVPRT